MDKTSPLADSFMMEVGYLSMYFSNFDYLLNEINATLINLDDYNIGNHISSKLTTYQRAELFLKLMDLIPFSAELKKTANKNISIYSTIRKRRNDFIHGFWHTRQEDEYTLEEFYLAKLQNLWGEAEKIDITEIKALKNQLRALITHQVQVNLDILNEYNKIIKNKSEQKELISLIFKNSKDLDEV